MNSSLGTERVLCTQDAHPEARTFRPRQRRQLPPFVPVDLLQFPTQEELRREIGNASCTSICQRPAMPSDAYAQTQSAWYKDSEPSTVGSLVQFFPGGIRLRFPRAYRKADWHFSLRVAIVPRSRHDEMFWLFGLSFEIDKSLGAEGSVCLTAPLLGSGCGDSVDASLSGYFRIVDPHFVPPYMVRSQSRHGPWVGGASTSAT